MCWLKGSRSPASEEEEREEELGVEGILRRRSEEEEEGGGGGGVVAAEKRSNKSNKVEGLKEDESIGNFNMQLGISSFISIYIYIISDLVEANESTKKAAR